MVMLVDNNTISTEADNDFLTLTTLLAVSILFLYTIAHSIFDKYKFHYIHESGLSMIVGILLTLITMAISPSVIIK
jgi:hypothetical protein